MINEEILGNSNNGNLVLIEHISPDSLFEAGNHSTRMVHRLSLYNSIFYCSLYLKYSEH